MKIVNVVLLVGALLFPSILNQTKADEALPIVIEEKNADGIPTRVQLPDSTSVTFPQGMFCLPRLIIGESCTDERSDMLWHDDVYTARTETRILDRVGDGFMLVILRHSKTKTGARLYLSKCAYLIGEGTLVCTDLSGGILKSA